MQFEGLASPYKSNYTFLVYRYFEQATELLLNDPALDHEYLPITGLAEFNKNAAKLAYGAESAPLKQGAVSRVFFTLLLSSCPGQVAVTQSISGTGALRIGGAFIGRHYPKAKVIYLPTPSWGNHTPIFKDSGLEVKQYRYYDKETVGLDFKGMLDDIKAAPEKSIVLLHACAHNPTGVDPTQEQWKEISNVVKVCIIHARAVLSECAAPCARITCLKRVKFSFR